MVGSRWAVLEDNLAAYAETLQAKRCITFSVFFFIKFKFTDCSVNSSGCQTRGTIISVHIWHYENGADFNIILLPNSCKAAVFVFFVSEEKENNKQHRVAAGGCSASSGLSCSIPPVGGWAPPLSHPLINQLSFIWCMKARWRRDGSRVPVAQTHQVLLFFFTLCSLLPTMHSVMNE